MLDNIETAASATDLSGLVGLGDIQAPRAGRRIMHLSKHCHHANGSVNVAVDLACKQAAAGHQVWFLSGGGSFVDLLERSGVRHVHLPQNQSKPAQLAVSAVRLARMIRGCGPMSCTRT